MFSSTNEVMGLHIDQELMTQNINLLEKLALLKLKELAKRERELDLRT